MSSRPAIPASSAFETVARGAQFRDRIAMLVHASPAAIFRALREGRVVPAGGTGEWWLVLEHATLALSASAQRKFSRYWRMIRPLGAFVTWLLLRAVRRRAESCDALGVRDGSAAA